MGYTGWLKDTGKPDNKGQEVQLLLRPKPSDTAWMPFRS
ncbi:hypothetical protein THARTR1_11262 [Trichoderma harzianum]|uniref:Uncharacterized protein n=1 Tax=Trichoderma harzianum TaxID=5544 RepID=A0A2K0T3R3_TRIHA|nr:hypothetical protein THARTR1_11262 [Trichoderma harzianum]